MLQFLSVEGNEPEFKKPFPAWLPGETASPCSSVLDSGNYQLRKLRRAPPRKTSDSVSPWLCLLHVICRSLHSRQWRVQGTAFKRSLEIGCPHASHTP